MLMPPNSEAVGLMKPLQGSPLMAGKQMARFQERGSPIDQDIEGRTQRARHRGTGGRSFVPSKKERVLTWG